MNETILLADDDELIVDVLTDQLRREGFQVLVAYDGDRALQLALQEDADLILLELMMPKRHGWEVCKEIRQHKTTPILMLTARGEEIDRVVGLELGADPIDFATHKSTKRDQYFLPISRSCGIIHCSRIV
jgi:DNA-binding response OmpR family regulator